MEAANTMDGPVHIASKKNSNRIQEDKNETNVPPFGDPVIISEIQRALEVQQHLLPITRLLRMLIRYMLYKLLSTLWVAE